jgi:hypothetical protein
VGGDPRPKVQDPTDGTAKPTVLFHFLLLPDITYNEPTLDCGQDPGLHCTKSSLHGTFGQRRQEKTA